MRRLPLLAALLVGALVLAFAVAGCGGGEAQRPGEPGGQEDAAKESPAGPEDTGRQISVSGGSYTRVPPSEFEALTREKGVTLVNTHIPFQGKLPRTDLSIPYDEVGQNPDGLPKDKDAEIALYCLGGPMSAEAAETLVGLGYTNVWDLGAAWRPGRTPATGSKGAETAPFPGHVPLSRSREGRGVIGLRLGPDDCPVGSIAGARTTQGWQAAQGPSNKARLRPTRVANNIPIRGWFWGS